MMRDLDLKGSPEDTDTWIKPAVKSCIYKYCEYVTTQIDGGTTIRNNPISINQGLQATQVLQAIQGIFDKYTIYLGSLVGAYDVSKSVGVNEEKIYP